MYVNKNHNSAVAAAITAAIGKRAHIKMNYVPWILTALACDQALKLCDILIERRADCLKGVCRRIKAAVRLYEKENAQLVGDGAPGLQTLFDDFGSSYTSDLTMTETIAACDARRTLRDDYWRCATHGALASAMLSHAWRLDAQADAKLSEILSKPIRRHREHSLIDLRKAIDEAAEWGIAPQLSPAGIQWVERMALRARQHADSIIDQEYGHEF